MAGLFPWLLPLLIYSIDQEIVSEIKYFPRAEKYINCRRLFWFIKNETAIFMRRSSEDEEKVVSGGLGGIVLVGSSVAAGAFGPGRRPGRGNDSDGV
jgi:hypothetical protein